MPTHNLRSLTQQTTSVEDDALLKNMAEIQLQINSQRLHLDAEMNEAKSQIPAVQNIVALANGFIKNNMAAPSLEYIMGRKVLLELIDRVKEDKLSPIDLLNELVAVARIQTPPPSQGHPETVATFVPVAPIAAAFRVMHAEVRACDPLPTRGGTTLLFGYNMRQSVMPPRQLHRE